MALNDGRLPGLSAGSDASRPPVSPCVPRCGSTRFVKQRNRTECDAHKGLEEKEHARSSARSFPTASLSSHEKRKHAAVHAGLNYILSTGLAMLRNDALLQRHGSDILLPFHVPLQRQTEVEAHALGVARQLARLWKERVCSKELPRRAPPKDLLKLMQGLYALNELGIGDPVLCRVLAEQCADKTATDFFKFDPLCEMPGAQLREECACGACVADGAATCASCRRPAVQMSPFDVWLEALVYAFHGCRMNIGMGACYFDILKQLANSFAEAAANTKQRASLRSVAVKVALHACVPPPPPQSLPSKDRHYLAYALTHVVYTLSNFNERALPADLFAPPLRQCLVERLRVALKKRDPDLAGECLDCLKCIGERGDLVDGAEKFLVDSQQADGGWSCEDGSGLFSRYHATLVAVGALMDHSYASREPVFPAAARVLPVWFSAEKAHADAARGGEQGAPSDCVDAAARTDAERLGRASSAETLCAVDHRHDEKRRRAMAAMDALPTLLISWPLRPADKETVALLPVMSRMQLRQALLEDKRKKRSGAIKQQLRLEADRRFIDRGGAGLCGDGLSVADDAPQLQQSRVLASGHRSRSQPRAPAG